MFFSAAGTLPWPIPHACASGTATDIVADIAKLARGEDRDVKLRSGDIVIVPTDEGRRLTQDTLESISKVFSFGVGGSVNLSKP